MAYNMPIKAKSKVNKRVFGVDIKKGDVVNLLVNKSGYAALAKNQMIRFGPRDYELHLTDEDYDKLLML